MTKQKIKIGVVSDVVCPWCYIGKRRLEKAIDKLSDKYEFEIEYFPFELNPHIPANGVNQREHLTEKFGGEDRFEAITSRTASVAAQEGLSFNFDAQTVIPNTRNAHRLIQLAKEDGKQLQLVEAFFKAYFTDGIDLSKKENLISISEQAGLDRAKVELFLKSSTGTTEVEMAELEIQKLGISGVPFYILNNKYGISGAQAPETFIEAFNNLGKEMDLQGEACDIDNKNC